MKIRMLQDAPGSPDGITVNEYDKGKVYDVPDALADTFVKYGLAEVDAPKPKTKKATGPTENKAVK